MNDFDFLTSVQLINILKNKENCTDYRAAKLLGISTSAMSLLMNGKTIMSDETAVKLARLIGYSPAVVVFSVMRERAARSNNSDMVEIIESLPPEYLRASCVVLSALLLSLAVPFHSILC